MNKWYECVTEGSKTVKISVTSFMSAPKVLYAYVKSNSSLLKNLFYFCLKEDHLVDIYLYCRSVLFSKEKQYQLLVSHFEISHTVFFCQIFLLPCKTVHSKQVFKHLLCSQKNIEKNVVVINFTAAPTRQTNNWFIQYKCQIKMNPISIRFWGKKLFWAICGMDLRNVDTRLGYE